MNKKSIFVDAYAPVEIAYLRLWLTVSACMSIFLIFIEWLKENTIGMQLCFVGLLLQLVVIFSLPDGKTSWKKDSATVASGLLIICGVLGFYASPKSIFLIWQMSWFIIPGLLSLYWLTSEFVTLWHYSRIDRKTAEKGLSRNKIMDIRLSQIGSHVILLHGVLCVLLPVLWILDVAISPGNALGSEIGDAFTTEHFEKILTGDGFWLWFRNSLLVSLGTTFFGLCIAIPAGYAFSRYKFRGRDEAMFSFLLVQMFPGVIILVPYFLVMKSLGLLNSHLGLILAYSVTALPLCVWMLKGFFDTVPRELEEAAMLDGCNQWQVFTKVVLPLSLPAIAVTALFSFLAAWNEFLLALTFNTSNSMYTLPVGLASMISSTGQAWGDFAAASLLVSIPVVILFIVFQKFLIEGLSAGGVKG